VIEGYIISSNIEDMDLVVIHEYISRSYWAKGIPFETLKRSVENSLCFGVFLSSGEQVGFARVITDKATFAYLADVFILEEHRGKGLSKWLMVEILEDSNLQRLRRIVLATRDAHGLYRKFGFTPLTSPDTFMNIHTPNIYLKP